MSAWPYVLHDAVTVAMLQKWHWRIQGALPVHTPPTGSISFVFAYVFTEKCTHQRLSPPPPRNGSAPPPQWKILDPPLNGLQLCLHCVLYGRLLFVWDFTISSALLHVLYKSELIITRMSIQTSTIGLLQNMVTWPCLGSMQTFHYIMSVVSLLRDIVSSPNKHRLRFGRCY